MSVARSGDVELYYESTGDGPPVLLVMGLGMNATGWWRTVPVLAESFRVLAFDNRGMGRSSAPEGEYAMADLADDAVAVLAAAIAACARAAADGTPERADAAWADAARSLASRRPD